MIEFLLKSTISLSIFLSFYYLVLQREKMHQFNRFYLLISIVVSFAIPFLTFEIIKIIPVVQNFETLNSVVTSSSIPESEIQEASLPIAEKINFTPYILWSLYVITSSILFIRFGKNIWKLISKSKTNPIVKYKKANLVLVEEKTLPHTFFNLIFINYDDYNNRTIEEELYAHELVHVNQKHTLDILFIELLKVIFWFNPLLIFYKKAIQLNHEFLADEEIVKTYNNVPFYQNLLLQKSSEQQTIYLASNLNYLVTKKRLIMMTKSTSQKIAVLKKIAIVPILAGLIYFFCIEVVAKEKVSTVGLIDKDKIRDNYYSGVYVKIIDEEINRKEVTLYEKLSLEDRRKYLSFIPEKIIENEIPDTLFKRLKSENIVFAINNIKSNKEEIKKYKRTDFSYYNSSSMYKNDALNKKIKEVQYSLYTKKFYDKNLKDIHVHFKLDTVIIGHSKYKPSLFKKANTDKSVWTTKSEDGYNLFIKERKGKKIVVIDVGHGGHDFGAILDDLNEKSLLSEITNKIKEISSDSDIEIHFTRTTDEFIGLKERTNIINKINPDLVISLHINSSENINKNGFEIYVSDKNELLEKSKMLAENLSINLSKTQLKNGGLKTAPFWILKNSNSPSLVVELGYISNEYDRKFISSEKGQTEIAKRIYEFIKD